MSKSKFSYTTQHISAATVSLITIELVLYLETQLGLTYFYL